MVVDENLRANLRAYIHLASKLSLIIPDIPPLPFHIASGLVTKVALKTLSVLDV